MNHLLALVVAVSLVPRLCATANELSESQLEGHRIALEVRELRLTEDARGILKIYKGRPLFAEIPFQLTTVATSSNWSSIYTTSSTNMGFVASLTVTHTPGTLNEYRLTGADTNQTSILTGNETMTPFAASDYWVADLGVEFLHWPGQRLLTNQVHRSQSCHKLESTNPAPGTNGYTRVISWIDIDTGGIVEAEAWDAKGKFKIFEPTSVQKVNGRYQVRELEIRNTRTRTKTILVFNYDK
ncbi:MAG: outer membrane lipoprotein-sorting protein [Verrucomicrobia bacterium]|nr:outer membrane lipoprotein-sorting protein [Verrucomicrobiota bacterium]